MPDYDDRADGTAPPAPLLARMTTPAALRARAEIRLAIAAQDRVAGDSEAYLRNIRVADDMIRRADNAR